MTRAATPRRLVERFYDDVWNKADPAAARELLHPDFRFRGSLGPERHGPEGFISYMQSVHTALAGYTCVIEDMVESDHRAVARMMFHGTHRGEFFGVNATGRVIRWAGAAFFTTNGRQITELWVLGDIDAVKQQLQAAPDAVYP